MACWGLIPKFWVKDKGFKEDDAIWGEQKIKPGEGPPEATELREGAFVAKILCDDREEEMEENMEQVSKHHRCLFLFLFCLIGGSTLTEQRFEIRYKLSE